MDETGAYYTEWSKPERKTPIQYTNAYIWECFSNEKKKKKNHPLNSPEKFLRVIFGTRFFFTLKGIFL